MSWRSAPVWFAASCGLWSCGAPDPELQGEPRCDALRLERPVRDANIVLIVDDTLRRDSAGVYGGRAKTPELDRFAREHLLFENALTQAPWTKPSIATLFTSLYPSQHGVAWAPQAPGDKQRQRPLLEVDLLAESFVTLAELLRDGGLETAAFVANPWLEGRYGFAQGFELYDDSSARWGASGDDAVDAALAWLAARDPGRPFFLYVHLMESHAPYGRIDAAAADAVRKRVNKDRYPIGLEGRVIFDDLTLSDDTPLSQAGFVPTRALIRTVYRLGVERFDHLLGRLLTGLRASDGWHRTAVIVTSDHGEALFERGYGSHGHGLYDDEAGIPLVARLPGVEPATGSVDCLVGLIDLLPTLVSYLGIDIPAEVEGWSFVSPSGSETQDDRRFLVTEGLMKNPSHRSIRNRNFKLMYEPDGRRDGRKTSGPWSLFHVSNDPEERLDLSLEIHDNPRVKRVFDALQRELRDAVPDFDTPRAERAPIDPQTRQRLGSLGYLRE